MSDFGKAVVKEIKVLKDDVSKKTSVDREVREQIQSDLDGLVEKHEKGGQKSEGQLRSKYWK